MSADSQTPEQIVARLHSQCGLHTRGYKPGECFICDAADEIERLCKGLKRLAGDRSDGPTKRIAQAILNGDQ